MYDENAPTERYILMFSPRSETSAWWTRWLHKDFVHVELLQEIEPGLYLGILPFHDYLRIEVLEGQPAGALQEVTATRESRKAMFPIGLKTCTSVAKAVLGIRSPWIVTPRQLYKYVESRQGVV